MNVKAFLVVVLFLVTSASAGTVLACGGGGCGGSSACSTGDDDSGYGCACADPSCNNGNPCMSEGRCCEAFGNIAATSVPNFDVDYNKNESENMAYEDYRGTDQAFNQQTYNTDAPRPRYK